MIVLSEIGVNIAPLLAGAGALGLAISFGSQTLVKDIITGVFIQFENGMNTGDLVTIGPLTGTVERMSIRSVGVRQDTGAYHSVRWYCQFNEHGVYFTRVVHHATAQAVDGAFCP